MRGGILLRPPCLPNTHEKKTIDSGYVALPPYYPKSQRMIMKNFYDKFWAARKFKIALGLNAQNS